MTDSLVKHFKRFLELRKIGPWDPSYLNGTVALLEALDRALGRVDGQLAVLDAGCGNEDHYAKKVRFGSKISRLVGVDIREDVDINTSLDLVIRANLYALPFDSPQFDIVFSDFVLEHLEDTKRAFAEFARVLKPGGRLVFRTPNFYHYVPVAALLLRKMGCQPVERFSADGERHEVFPTFYRANTCRRLKWLARGSGFAVEEMILAEGGPHYLEFFLPFYLIGVMHQYLVNNAPLLYGLRGNIIGVFRKQGRG
jgi:SAM-dependent methyltransferase